MVLQESPHTTVYLPSFSLPRHFLCSLPLPPDLGTVTNSSPHSCVCLAFSNHCLAYDEGAECLGGSPLNYAKSWAEFNRKCSVESRQMTRHFLQFLCTSIKMSSLLDKWKCRMQKILYTFQSNAQLFLAFKIISVLWLVETLYILVYSSWMLISL